MYIGKKYYIKDLELNQKVKIQVIDIKKHYIIYLNLILNIEIKRNIEQIEILDFLNEIEDKKELKTIQTKLIKAVIGRNELMEYSKNNFQELNVDENTVLISITDIDRKDIDDEILKQFKNYFSISFKDISFAISKNKPLSFKQAYSIRLFIEKNNNNNFVIHCEEGISRSPGLALAIYKILKPQEFNSFEEKIKTFERYSPNYEVFELITRNKKYTIINKIKDIFFNK